MTDHERRAETVAASVMWALLRGEPYGVVPLPDGLTAAFCGRPSAARDHAFAAFLADAEEAGCELLAEGAHGKDHGGACDDGLPETAARDWMRVALLRTPGGRLPDGTPDDAGAVLKLLCARLDRVSAPRTNASPI